jgi:hypothetical protein
MSGAIPPLPQYAFMAWCLAKAQGQLYLLPLPYHRVQTCSGPTQPPIQLALGALSMGVKRPGRETDNSPLSSAEVKNAWSYTSTSPIRLHGVVFS